MQIATPKTGTNTHIASGIAVIRGRARKD